MKYHWQHQDWPKFIYNPNDFDHVVRQFQNKAYSLLGRLAQITIESQQEAYILLMVEEAIKSSEIEGENLNSVEVRSSVARFLGLKVTPSAASSLKEEGMAALLINVRESLAQKLSKEKLCYWHKLLIQEDSNPRKPILKGDYRDGTVDVIKDDLYGNVKVIYQAPGLSKEDVTHEMDMFLDWYNATMPSSKDGPCLSGPVRAAVAHLWFVSIHPFEDGNGRIGRAIAEHALYQDFDNPPLFSLSSAINKNRKHYYQQLQATNERLDISNWIHWFVDIVHEAQISAIQKVDFILKKAKFWQKHQETALNERQRKAISKVFSAGPEGLMANGMSNEKYRNMTKCSQATATRDLKDLVEKEMLYLEGAGKRSIRYKINFVEDSVFRKNWASSQKGDRDKFIEAALEKLITNMRRNIEFQQDRSDPKLLALIEHYQQLADGDTDALNKLKNVLLRHQ